MDTWRRRKEGNVLFNDALNTFYLRLYGVRHMVKDHLDSERGNPLPPHGLLFPISSKGYLYAVSTLSIAVAPPPPNIFHQEGTKCFIKRRTQHILFTVKYVVRHMVKDHSDTDRGKPAAATWATLSD